MQRPVKSIKSTVGSIVKPVTSLVDGFNALMRRLEEKTDEEKKKGVEIDGFVNVLLDEMKDVEQGIFAFFTEMLFMHHLSEKMAQVENEVTLVSILAERVKDFLNPDFIEVFLCGADKYPLQLAYHYPSEKEFNPADVRDMAGECFLRGESTIFSDRKISGRIFSVLSVPLRTTRDRFGTMIVGKKGRNRFRSEDVTLVIAGAAVVSFSISNIKLMNSMIKNERLATIGETIGGLSHDIKNILNSLENGIALVDIASEKNDWEILNEGRKIVKNSYEKMKNLVLSMIDYSRERDISLQLVDINRIVREVLDAMKEAFVEKEIKIVRKLDDNMPKIYVDPSRLERLVVNLVNNALDAVEEKKTGIIKVGTRFSPDEGIASLWVEDNGCGISEKNIDKIFSVFYSTKGTKGTGFGLAIVQKIVKEHGGLIEVNSTVGKGTRFLVKIPVKKHRRRKNG
jgi:signal transduction histidine kinase